MEHGIYAISVRAGMLKRHECRAPLTAPLPPWKYPSTKVPIRKQGNKLEDAEDTHQEQFHAEGRKNKEAQKATALREGDSQYEYGKRGLRTRHERKDQPPQQHADDQRDETNQPERRTGGGGGQGRVIVGEEKIDHEDSRLERSPHGPPDNQLLFGAVVHDHRRLNRLGANCQAVLKRKAT